MAAPWRNCRASITLADEVNRRWPDRDRSSDGTVGDAAHASRSSDHNPWIVIDKVGVIRARDVDKDGIDAPWLAEFLRRRGEVGDPRLTGGGYVIFNRRITTPDFRGWKVYTGKNPHTAHLHVSFSRNRAGFDSAAAWDLAVPAAPAPAPAAAGRPSLTYGMRGNAELRKVQLFMARVFRDYARDLAATGNYIDETTRVIAEFQRRTGITGPDADGRTIGPRTWAQLVAHGYR